MTSLALGHEMTSGDLFENSVFQERNSLIADCFERMFRS